jgi:hypothetical protein
MKAFPTAIDNGHSENQDGMDLRDYFAAKVMEAYLNKTIVSYQHNDGIEIKLPLDYLIGEAAYQIADAMMEARKIRR